MNPFTEAQLKELELQTLIFNYMALGLPIPSSLIAHCMRSFCCFDPYPLYHSMSGGKRVEEDSEPWRCKRTDGKKWRCSKETFQDSKYCERHMHRGKKSSRKLVENLLPSSPFSTKRPSLEFSHPNTNVPMFLDSPPYKMPTGHQNYRDRNGDNEDEHACYNFFSDHKEEEKHDPCDVLGADLMLGNPLRVERRKDIQKPKTSLCLFNECVDTEEAYSKTQLSISIP